MTLYIIVSIIVGAISGFFTDKLIKKLNYLIFTYKLNKKLIKPSKWDHLIGSEITFDFPPRFSSGLNLVHPTIGEPVSLEININEVKNNETNNQTTK